VNDLGDVLEDTTRVLDVGNSSRMEAVVGGLRADSVYQFEMLAYTRKTEGDWTRHRRVKTHGAGTLLVALTTALSEYSLLSIINQAALISQ